MPPYAPLLEWVGHRIAAIRLHVGNYQMLWSDPLYLDSLSLFDPRGGGLDAAAACCWVTRWRSQSHGPHRRGAICC